MEVQEEAFRRVAAVPRALKGLGEVEAVVQTQVGEAEAERAAGQEA